MSTALKNRPFLILFFAASVVIALSENSNNNLQEVVHCILYFKLLMVINRNKFLSVLFKKHD